jgi:type IV fimbrial biogenesis protein FimT
MRNPSGFTLMELMITLAVICLLAGIAIPGYIGWLPKRHLQSSAIEVQAAIILAKHTAIRENSNVVLTFFPGSESYLAFIDTGDGVGGPPNGNQDAGERTVRNKGISPGINLDNTTLPGDALTFDSRGLANTSGDIILVNKRGENRTINVTITGMSRIEY